MKVELNKAQNSVIECDLRPFQCPQLFVQFKWQLKQAKTKAKAVRFFYTKEQDLRDVMRYLNNQDMVFQHNQQSEPFFIQVECIDD
ncbi:MULTISPECIES: hypothetical protein [Pseudoalteromonas]|uniref:hypothetical protein n=1 Tax=Pseudoalteromonas TaxID=53246 RepID=UPI000F76AD98|nr:MULTISPECIES: hypothetical protein [Pseudoalteromonas]MCG7563352.1 hypothetical protein [Pseudoalteromonas sp. McH1-42]MEC4089654.1 hypothetical protein [Pseudoalteromonas rubra]